MDGAQNTGSSDAPAPLLLAGTVTKRRLLGKTLAFATIQLQQTVDRVEKACAIGQTDSVSSIDVVFKKDVFCLVKARTYSLTHAMYSHAKQMIASS